ncbi:PEP/pyruvate-binding domain-containing protein [Fundidesulfovibrio agrisoli]|uniref:PEP/pyruvate-binding domain-containing protein n=1 Tax=Fundidesulfovibrio agrisoli TaxID=2922717 RepID=UPI001FAB7C44|nr:PEP/pyruvate-binding domain-containing protein [Fundidesulfovibrio agrisoli]
MDLPGIKELLSGWRKKPPVPFTVLFKKFKSILERNNAILELIGDMGDKLGGDYVFDRQYILDSCEKLGDQVFKLVSDLSLLCQRKNVALFTAFERVQHQIREELAGRRALSRTDHILPLSELTHDLADEGGNKMSSLGDIGNILGFTVPEGFVITAGAYFEAMEHAGLRKRAAEASQRLCEAKDGRLEQDSRELRQAILAMPLPKGLSRAVEQAARKLSGGGRALLAVRSSAWGEDSESSFAGMYETVLGVAPENILEAYRRVLASLFCEQALRYRLHHGQGLGQNCEEPAMAVGVVRMVDAETSGGLYTYAPLEEHGQPMVVSAAWGLGKPIVDGTAETDTYFLRRDPPHEPVSVELSAKTTRLVLDPAGGTRTEPVPEELRNAACLDGARLFQLAEAAMTLERFFRRPLDVEWAFTREGGLVVLQARPLSIRPRTCSLEDDVSEAAKDAPVVFSGKGITAMGGVSSGRVQLVGPEENLDGFPYGAILVARHSSPRFARIMPRCRGIITDVGSATGHMATIARELRVPTLVGAGNATRVLEQGREITLDADHKVVYEGAVEALCRYELSKEDVFEESWEYRTLKRVLRHISPLTLLDPNAESFRPEAAKTFHDIARYVHQRAVDKLISLAETHQEITEGAPRRLATKLPLGLTVIDVEGGLEPGAGDEVGEEQLRCRPLRALMEGMNAQGMWETRPVPVDIGSFMSSVTRTFSADQSHPAKMGRNLAVVSREYLNLHLRLGYHFTVVDAYLGGSINDNAVFFRFMGGVTDLTRRSRRARLVSAILEQFDFKVETKGDMVTGRVKKHPTRAMLDKMFMLGALIGYTRQLDALMDSDEACRMRADEFLQRLAALREAKE